MQKTAESNECVAVTFLSLVRIYVGIIVYICNRIEICYE